MIRKLFFLSLMTGLISTGTHCIAEDSTKLKKSNSSATVKESIQEFTTYPYSDPDPVPRMSKFYPYFRYDGFTAKSSPKKWKTVELSNEHLKIMILPEIGGKTWSAVERSTGRSLIYANDVVKFRDISMRGPWTSGGIESNYGIIGHTPNCFAPVDYIVSNNKDGSVSCVIGVLDLLTRTTWRLEINLQADAASFTTRSFWYNPSGLEQPYYTWMNVGIKAAGNLQFVYPATHYIGHDGKATAWPIDPKTGKDVSWYEHNNHGSYKSYHGVGRLTDFFGGYWHDDDFGMAHVASYADKPGKKVWIWGLSRQGMIWEDLLTDTNGQYVEVQSGRLFNQAATDSSKSPFKNREFAPYATDSWIEHWLPVKGIGGYVSASPYGALNIIQSGKKLTVRVSPVKALRSTMEVFDGDQLLDKGDVDLSPMRPFTREIHLAATPKALRVRIGGDKLTFTAGDWNALSRPLEPPSDFDWTSVYGLYLKGKELIRQHLHPEAAKQLEECLQKDPNFLPALADSAMLANRRGDYKVALNLARKALAIDAYDPGANYQYGLANTALGQTTDAIDGFSIASLNAETRSASLTELAKLYLHEKLYDRALACAEDSLDNNRRNLDAFRLQACIYRLQKEDDLAEKAVSAILALDPLDHLARFERYLRNRCGKEEVTGLIRNELPHETYLELAVWYRSAGRDDDAAKALELAPPTAEVLYWLAYLRRDKNLLAKAEAATPEFVFPFRTEALPVFNWAHKETSSWRPAYYLALIHWYQGDIQQAQKLLSDCQDKPDFTPFYAVRAQVCGATAIRDLNKAAALDPKQWRYGVMLAKEHLKQNDHTATLGVTGDYMRRFPDKDILSLLHVRALILSGQHQAAVDLLSSLHVLPCEGSTEAHSLWREANLMLALENMKNGAFDKALIEIDNAREWRESLGAGKPYPEDCDERIEDWLAYRCHVGRKTDNDAKAMLTRITTFKAHPPLNGTGELVSAWALRESGKAADGESVLTAWLAREPASEAAKWALAVYRGNTSTSYAGGQDDAYHVLSAWLKK